MKSRFRKYASQNAWQTKLAKIAAKGLKINCLYIVIFVAGLRN